MTMGHSDSPRVAKLNEELKELQYKLELLEAEYSNTPGFKKVKSAPNEDGEDTHGYLMTKEFLLSPLYKLIKRIGEVNSELEDRKEEGQNAKYLIHDVKEGSLISYLIRSDDKNIQNPIAVLNVKPYVKEHGENFILVSDNNMYGQGRPEFKSTVDSILNEINGDVEAGGYYCLSNKIYADSQPRRIFSMDKDVNKFYVAAQNYLKNNIEPIVESAFEDNLPSAIDSAFEAYSSENDIDFDELYEFEDSIKILINSQKQSIIDLIVRTGDFNITEADVYFSYDLFKKIYPKDKDNVEKFVKYYFKDNQLEISSIDDMLQEDLFSIIMGYLDDNFHNSKEL